MPGSLASFTSGGSLLRTSFAPGVVASGGAIARSAPCSWCVPWRPAVAPTPPFGTPRALTPAACRPAQRSSGARESAGRSEAMLGGMGEMQRRRGPIRVYKNRDAGAPRKAPRCICCFPANRAGQVVPLRYGVQLVLCAEHRDPAWIAGRNGRDFLASVGATMTSFGLSHRRYGLALASFVREVVGRGRQPARPRPGSYAWPGVRASAEAVWARGGSYHDGEGTVARHAASAPSGWRAPSPHTVRRWWREKRWLLSPTPRRAPRASERRAERPGAAAREEGRQDSVVSAGERHSAPDARPRAERHAPPRARAPAT